MTKEHFIIKNPTKKWLKDTAFGDEYISKSGIIFRIGDEIIKIGEPSYKRIIIGSFFFHHTRYSDNTIGVCCYEMNLAGEYIGNSDYLEHYHHVDENINLIRWREKKLNRLLNLKTN